MTTPDDPRIIVEERAPAGTTRIRRRRLAVAATGMAALIAVAAVVVPLSLRRNATQASVADGKAVAGRQTGQLTLGVDRKSRLAVSWVRTQDHLQHIRVVAKNCHGRDMTGCGANSPLMNVGANVYAFDPGTYDATVLRQGEPMTVAGRPAWYQPSYPVPSGVTGVTRKPGFAAVPALGRQDPSGAWVLVTAINPLAKPPAGDLAELAAEIRLSPPHDVVAPLRLGPLPGGLRLSRTEFNPDGPTTTLALTAAREPGTASVLPASSPFEGKDYPLWVFAVPLPGGKLPAGVADSQKLKEFDRYKVKAAPPINGHQAWIADNDAYGQSKGYFKLIVDAGNCSLAFVTYDSRAMTPAQIRTIAEGTEYGDCENQSRWVPPVSR